MVTSERKGRATGIYGTIAARILYVFMKYTVIATTKGNMKFARASVSRRRIDVICIP